MWLFSVGFSHHILFSVSVDSLAMNFCSRMAGLGPQARGRLSSPLLTRQRAKCEVTVEWLGEGRRVCSCVTLRGSGLSIWQLLAEDEAGLGELTFSSGSTGKRAHSSVLGLAHGRSLLALLGTSLSLQGARAALHTLGEAEVAAVGAVVQVSQPRQGQDVVTGDPQDSQFGQLLPV